MSNSFDNKVFDFLKASDNLFPVSCRMKFSKKSPPEEGKWSLVGIYGRYEYTNNNISHSIDFIGTSMLDYVRTTNKIKKGDLVSWNYDSQLGSGNYSITTLFGSYLNTNVQDVYQFQANLTNTSGEYDMHCDGKTVQLSIQSDTANAGFVTQIRALINDVNKISIPATLLSYEYERTA